MPGTSFGGAVGTITAGIQDVSPLLPLLGTEQCEKHIGSALDRGYLYCSVIPISIFGSLGPVRSAFNIFLASLNIQRYGFVGATKLGDAGFTTTGVVAPMIALDHEHPKRFLVETKLEDMLKEEHIENVEDLTVSCGKGILWWNFLLIVFTLAISSAGLVPYIHLVLHSPDHYFRELFPLGFGFPILRISVIQIRILVLLKTRLLFITIDRLAKEAGIDLEFEINSKPGNKKAKNLWTSEAASEECIWKLQRTLAANTDAESLKNHSAIQEIYTSQYKRHMESIDTHIPTWVGVLLVVGLVLGALSTVVGYIGCFYIIEHSTRSNGPLLWLILETLLSLFRILVWAFNPSWDDPKGIVFELQLASHAPLITCNKFEGDIVRDGIAPLTPSNNFLEDVVAYTGFPAFVVPDGALYYIRTAKGGSESTNNKTPPPGILYILVSDRKERTSRILFKQGPQHTFSIYVSSLEPVPGSTAINARVDFSKEGRRTEPKTRLLTSDAAFMTQLGAYYDEINSQMQKQRFNTNRRAFLRKTWTMRQPTEDDDSNDANFANDGNDAAQLAIKDRQKSNPLTAEDMAYLRQGQIERRWHDMYKQLEVWIELFITLYTKELLLDVPADLVFKKDVRVTIVQRYEANEVEFLLIECRIILELLLLCTGRKWDEYLKMNHAGMTEAILQGTFESMADLKHGGGTPRKRHSDEIRRTKMMTRLADELEDLLGREVRTRRCSMRNRLIAQMESTNERIQRRKYIDAVGEAIMDVWETLPTDIPLEAAKTSDPSSTREETDSVVKPALRSGSVVSLNATHIKIASIEDHGNVLSSSGSMRQSQDIDGKKCSAKSNMAQVVKAVESRRKEFKAKMHTRYQEAVKDVNNLKYDVERRNQLGEVEQMDARCQQRAEQLFSMLEAQTVEFEDLHTNDVLTANTHELVDYWSNKSLQERMRLQDRTQQYLRLTDASIEAVGGRQNMLRALKRSQDFSFIDIHESSLLTCEDLTSVVE